MRAALLALVAAAPASVLGRVLTHTKTPVSKVVAILQEVQDKVDQEGEVEEDLFQNYSCWAKRSTKEKEAAIKAAESRTKMLENRIKELDSGEGAETNEAAKLAGELEETLKEIKASEKQREDEEAKNEEAIQSGTDAVNGLKEAQAALSAIALGSKVEKKSLLSLRGGLSSRDRARQGHEMTVALKEAQKELSKADYVFLHRILTADVSPASFMQEVSEHTGDPSAPAQGADGAYVSRTGGIMETLKKLGANFEKDLTVSKENEAKAEEVFTKLMEEKGLEKSNLETAVRSQEREKEARAFKKQQAQEEVEALAKQVASDKEFNQAVADALEKKQAAYDQRVKVRTDELTAISKAIETLHSDSARDNFAKAYSFLQESKEVNIEAKEQSRQQASDMLHQNFAKFKDSRILGVALSLASSKSTGHFDKVFEKMDKLVTVLDEEEAADKEKKETCEKNLEDDTKESEETTKAISDLNDNVDTLKETVEQQTAQIAEKKDEIKKIAEELEEATKDRQAEAKAAAAAKSEDDTAMVAIEAATKTIQDFYDGQKSFLQTMSINHHKVKGKGSEPDLSGAPDTGAIGGDDYKGNQAGGARLVELLGEVKKDLADDMASAKTAEENAIKMYEDAKKALEDQTANLNGQVDDLTAAKGEAKSTQSEKETEVETKTEELKALKKKMADVKPNCDFYVDKYADRKASREAEKTGIAKAKEILEKYDA